MAKAVSIRLESLELPTYLRGKDSPYPTFMLHGSRYSYPYSMQTDLTNNIRPVKHRAVVLENEYIRAVVLPDMGGKLFSLFDKTAGHDAFMVPPSIKFQNISLRGAWTAGGIEFNYGTHHHTAHSVNPITWAMRQDDDGGASVWIGSVIRPMETRYAARIRLRPGRAAVDIEFHSTGAQTLPGLMYYWANTGVEVTEHSKFYYYGYSADMGGHKHSWPVVDGKDFTWYRNRFNGGDMFLEHCVRDYMAFYDFGRHHGVANIASRFDLMGEKYFTWGNDQSGRFWDLMLSDAGQAYCEIQRGRLNHQGQSEMIPTMSCDGWVETWMPLNSLDGFDHLENDIALAVLDSEDGKSAEIRLLAATAQEKLELEAFCGEVSLGKRKVAALTPGKYSSIPVELRKGQKCDHIVIRDSQGTTLVNWTEFQFKDQDWFSDAFGAVENENDPAEKLFFLAEQHRGSSWPQPSKYALTLYEKALKKDPGHIATLQALAEIALYNGQFDVAESRCKEALKRQSNNREVQALLGWTHFRQGRWSDAVEQFSLSARYQPGRRNGLVGVAWSYIRANQWDQAAAAVLALLEEFPADHWGRLLKVMVLRKAGQKQAARELLGELLAADPLSSRLTAEALLLGVKVDIYDGKRKLADDTITCALPYLELGLWEDAIAILRVDESNEPFSPALRLVHLAYACSKAGDNAGAKAALKQLAKAELSQAHPWAIGSLVILEEMAGQLPDQAMIQAMLGNIMASRLRMTEAKAAWHKAIDLGLEHTVLYRNLAHAAYADKDKKQALKHFEMAYELASQDVACFVEYDHLLADLGLHKRRLALYDGLNGDIQARSAVGLRYVLALLDNSRYEQAMHEMQSREFLVGEGERMLRVNYLEAVVGIAMDQLSRDKLDQARDTLLEGLKYPRNMNIGRMSVAAEEAMVRYFLGLVEEMLGNPEQARKHWTEAATESHGYGDPNQGYELLSWVALGKPHRAFAVAHQVEKQIRGEEPMHVHWKYTEEMLWITYGIGLVLKGRIDEARKAWEDKLKESRGFRWFRVHLNIPRKILHRMARKGQ